MISIFVVPGVTLLVFFAMPWIGRSRGGRVFNAAFSLGVLIGAAVLAWLSYAHDAKDANYQAAILAGRRGSGAGERARYAGEPRGRSQGTVR